MPGRAEMLMCSGAERLMRRLRVSILPVGEAWEIVATHLQYRQRAVVNHHVQRSIAVFGGRVTTLSLPSYRRFPS